MKMYRVWVREEITYRVTVFATSKTEAKQRATKIVDEKDILFNDNANEQERHSRVTEIKEERFHPYGSHS